jgi:hypothetical protein
MVWALARVLEGGTGTFRCTRRSATAGTMTRDRSALRRLSRAGLTNVLLFSEASMTLASSSLAIALLPFKRLHGLLGHHGSNLRAPTADERRVRQICWAVEAAAKRLPWRTVCFQKGVALHWMLRRRGIPTYLHYGVGKSPEAELAAHVWISHQDVILMGGDVASDFTCVATYPGEHPLRSSRQGAT